MRESGVRIAHEGAERKVAYEVTVTELLFSAGKGLVEKPMVRLTNIICEKLTKLLEHQVRVV